MDKTALDVYRYSNTVVLVFVTIGNILVIISILTQKKVLKNNYYLVVLHLAICDLGVLSVYLIKHINWYLVEEQLFTYSTKYCAFRCITFFFQNAGIGMMLIISVLRYRATVHPLKPDVSRRKLKVVCGLVTLLVLLQALQQICRCVSCSGHRMSQLFIIKFCVVASYHAFTLSQYYLWL